MIQERNTLQKLLNTMYFNYVFPVRRSRYDKSATLYVEVQVDPGKLCFRLHHATLASLFSPLTLDLIISLLLSNYILCLAMLHVFIRPCMDIS